MQATARTVHSRIAVRACAQVGRVRRLLPCATASPSGAGNLTGHYPVEIHLDLQASPGPGPRAQRRPVRDRDRPDDGQAEPVPAVAIVAVAAHPGGAELLKRLEQAGEPLRPAERAG